MNRLGFSPYRSYSLSRCLFCYGLSAFFVSTAILPSFVAAETEPVSSAPGITNCAFPDFSALAKSLSPSVVNVSVDSAAAVKAEAEAEEKGKDEEAKRDPDSPFKSVGSGFIIESSGYIVTNYHVVGTSDSAIVRLLDDKTEYPARVVGKDQKTDLALLKISPRGALRPVKLGNSDQLEVGEWVVAIGNQFQLGQTVTAGIVSAKSRKVPTRAGPYDSFIQTDASINPGSSGGPLFNSHGEVVGINSAIFSPGRTPLGGTGFNIGIGFAIPINVAKSVVEQLKDKGRVTRGLLGVMVQQVDTQVADALGIDTPDGALVADVMPNTPAARAGFKRLDVITKFDGHPVRDFDDLPMMVASTPIGSTVEVEIVRSKRIMGLKVTIEEMKESRPEVRQAQVKFNSWGLALENLTPEITRSFGLTASKGVVVTGVEDSSAAEKAGFLRGDVIDSVNGTDTPDLSTLDVVVSGSSSEHALLISVKRREATRVLAIKPPRK